MIDNTEFIIRYEVEAEKAYKVFIIETKDNTNEYTENDDEINLIRFMNYIECEANKAVIAENGGNESHI